MGRIFASTMEEGVHHLWKPHSLSLDAMRKNRDVDN